MPTQNWSVASGTYASMASGAKKFNAYNPQAQAVEYVVASSTPSASTVGIRLGQGQTHPIDVASGENVYMRIAQTGALTTIVIAALEVP